MEKCTKCGAETEILLEGNCPTCAAEVKGESTDAPATEAPATETPAEEPAQ